MRDILRHKILCVYNCKSSMIIFVINNYSLFKCSEKLPEEKSGVSLAPTYTCARGILADCTKPGDLKARILFVGTISEANDDIDFSDLSRLYGITDTHSCEKALRSLDH